MIEYQFTLNVFRIFDEKHFNRRSPPLGQEVIACKMIQQVFKEAGMPQDTVYSLGSKYIRSMSDWRVFCLETPTSKKRHEKLVSLSVLEDLSKAMLGELKRPVRHGVSPTVQLLSYVFEDTFKDLSPTEQLVWIEKITKFSNSSISTEIKDVSSLNPAKPLNFLENTQIKLKLLILKTQQIGASILGSPKFQLFAKAALTLTLSYFCGFILIKYAALFGKAIGVKKLLNFIPAETTVTQTLELLLPFTQKLNTLNKVAAVALIGFASKQLLEKYSKISRAVDIAFEITVTAIVKVASTLVNHIVLQKQRSFIGAEYCKVAKIWQNNVLLMLNSVDI